jgi:hypothetical protein
MQKNAVNIFQKLEESIEERSADVCRSMQLPPTKSSTNVGEGI